MKKNKLSYSIGEPSPVKRLLIKSLERVSGHKRINGLYEEIQQMELTASEVWGEALKKLKIEPLFDQKQLEKIPREGPIVIIANHPYGVVDGLIMGYLASLVRSHFCVLVNEVLTHQDPRLNEQLLPIDFGETRAALQTNLLTRKEALGRLERGEAIVIFPSGGVATSPKGWGKAEDLEWKRFTAKMIQMAKATVVPVYVPGQNSRLFQLASQISPALRLGMLLNEVRNKMGSQIKLEIGDPIPFATLASVKDRQLLLDLLREKTFSLADKHSNP